ncbi:signal peptide peptidase SppA [bacterium]|nr:signal peptide peptidase SppA [bacterium]
MRNRLFVIALLLAVLASLTGCIFIPFQGPVRRRDMAVETLIEAQSIWTSDQVLLVSLDGLLDDEPREGGWFSRPSALVQLKDVLDYAESDHRVKALLLRVNSPGGQVTASDLIHQELKRFKEKTGVKIAVICMDLAASGGYYAAMAGDEIWALPTTVTGSIGVIAFFPEIGGLGRKIGLDMRVIKSGEYKDTGSMWREFSKGDREILQGVIDEMHERFVNIVVQGRPRLSEERVRELANGRIYTAKQALEAGLIDHVGNFDQAFEGAKRLAGIEDASLVACKYPGDYHGNYYAWARSNRGQVAESGPQPQINLFRLDLGESLHALGTPFYYLWLP